LTLDRPEHHRIRKWREELQSKTLVPPAENLPSGENQSWTLWKTLNSLRAGVAKTKANMVK